MQLHTKPVDFYVLPLCDNEYLCQADGTYSNEDGNFTLEGNINVYDISYEQNFELAPDKVYIQFSQSMNATNYTNGVINTNDMIGGIHIFNAAA